MSRKSRRSSRRRPRRKAPPRPSPRVLLLTLALPLLGVVLWLGYKYVEGGLRRNEPPVASPPKVAEPPPPITSTAVETPRIEQALVDAGVSRDRMRWENGHLLVETFDPPDVIVDHLEKGIPGSVVTRSDGMIIVRHGDIEERLRVVQLERNTDGFVPADVDDNDSVHADITEPAGARKIVLILDDVGFENQPLEDAAEIDARLNFAVIPGSPRATRSAEYLASRGFEILCHLPMEPLDYPNVQPGELAIFTGMSDDEIRTLTSSNIALIPHAKGVNNHMGSRATRDRRVMMSVADALRQSGVYFIDSRTAGSSIAATVTRAAKIPTGSRDVFLDDDPTERGVRRQLRQLVRLSDSREYVIGIGHVYPTTIKVLREEIPKLSKSGYEFLFASEVIR